MVEFNGEANRRKFQRWLHVAVLLLVLLGLAAGIACAQDRSLDNLRNLNHSMDALIKKVSPRVVQVLVTGFGPLEEGDHGGTSAVIGRQRAIGSGFVIDESGYIMTNARVVSGAQRVQMILPNTDTESSLQAALSTRTRIVPGRIVGVSLMRGPRRTFPSSRFTSLLSRPDKKSI
ncbi:MAG TPA: S1C family serine protease [Candidatus Acidoferrum sp.]|nr:S1C family serine protease [Candidatus Acidoferrum sp.]